MQLRPYQQRGYDGIREAYAHGFRRILFVCPTGAGKTVTASDIIRKANDKGHPVIFLAHTREIIYQTHAKLRSFGIDAGILMAGESRNIYAKTYVASVQTLHHRAFKTNNERYLPKGAILIIDEAHRSLAKTYLQVIDHYCSGPEGAMLLGLTATPCRGDGRGLGHIYETIVLGPTVRELTKAGYLVPVEYYAPTIPDLSGVDVRMGDYVTKQLGEVMNNPTLIGDVVEQWIRISRANGGERQTCVFTPTVACSMAVKEAFESEGFAWAHIDGETDRDERAEILKRLEAGELRGVSNCMVLTEGWDCPAVKHLVLFRPTKSLGLYMQMSGRGLRPCPDTGWDNMILQDHSGAVHIHGRIDEPVPWSLDTKGKIGEAAKKAREKEPKLLTCDACGHVWTGSLACPACGTEIKKRPEMLPFIEGNLVRMTREDEELMLKDSGGGITIEEFIREVKWIQKDKGHKPGWIKHQVEAKFHLDHLPSPVQEYIRNCAPAKPRGSVERWIKSRMIAFYKSKKFKKAGSE